jgi:hypothetical protein
VPKVIKSLDELNENEGAVYIGAMTAFNYYCNNLKDYEAFILLHPSLHAQVRELKGKNLYCECRREDCHGEVLLRLANA